MTFEGTIYIGKQVLWKVRISPNGIKDTPEEIFKVWFPDGKEKFEKRWVFYNPKISIIIQNKFDKTNKIYIPISMLYALKDAIQVMFNRLRIKDLYKADGNQLYMDNNLAAENRVRIPIFSDTILFVPTVITYNEDEYVRGVKIEATNSDDVQLEIDINELKTIFEVLDRLDINTYGLILSLCEQLGDMDQKIDKILDIQNKILKLLEKDKITSIQEKGIIQDEFKVIW